MRTPSSASLSASTTSLASVPIGIVRRYRIGRVLFDGVRHRCSLLGIEEGAPVTCQRKTESAVYVEVPGGGWCLLDLEDARFVEVAPAPDVAAVA